MDHSCDQGLHRLAQTLSTDLDLSNVRMSAPVDAPPTNDTATIFTDGTIITMAGGKLSPVESLAIYGAKIIAAGSLAKSEQIAKQIAGAQVHIKYLKGNCLLPGFIEPHLHVLGTALAKGYLIDFSPLQVKSRAEAEALVREHVANIKDNASWVAGFGWDPSRVAQHRDLNIDLLDAWSERTINGETVHVPVFINNLSGHLAYVNTEALKRAGIPPDTTDPNFTRKYGKLTGIVVELGIVKVAAPIPRPSTVDQWATLCAPVFRSWAGAGCTTVFDAGIGGASDYDLQLMAAVTTNSACTPLPVRILGAVSINSAEKGLLPSDTPPVLLGNVTVRSIKYWADGSTQGFTAAVNEPYINNLNPNGNPCGTLNYPYNSKKETPLKGLMSKWMSKGWQLLVHSNGDRATDQTLDCYEAIMSKNNNEKIMHRIEHFTVTSRNQVERAANLGLGISHTIGHVYYWGQAFIEWVLGHDRAMRIDPVHDDNCNELCFSFNSDSPVTDVAPLLYIKTAISRLMTNGEVLGGKQCVGLETALRGVTTNAAKQVLMGEEIGSLEVGKNADLVILGENLTRTKPEKIDGVKVVETWLEGREVWSLKDEPDGGKGGQA